MPITLQELLDQGPVVTVRKQSFEQPADEVAKAFLEEEADLIARRHEISPDRVCQVLEGIARRYGEPVWLEEDLAAWVRVPRFSPWIEMAMRCHPPEEALALLEREDLERLVERDHLTNYLSEDDRFYTLEELADLADAFADYLGDNRESLLATGLPETDYNLWPAPLLVNLYQVKMPANVFEARYTRWSRGTPSGSARVHTWCRLRTNDDGVMVPCTYEEAPLIDGLDPSDAGRLVAGRPTLLDLKRRILHRLARALRAHDTSDLWPVCLHLLTGALLADEAAFYLRMDGFWGHYPPRIGQSARHLPRELLPGGLSELLEVIGYCEKELTIGTKDRTKRAMRTALGAGGRWPYLAAMGKPWRPELDASLDLFLGLDAQEPAFWNDFRARVNEALENDFYAEVVIRTKVKQKLVATFEPQVRTFVEWQRTHLEATGTLPLLQLSSPVPPPVAQPSVFRREGKVWTISYAGTTVHLKDSKGLHYMAQLLRQPGQEIHVMELVAAVDWGKSAAGGRTLGSSQEALADAGVRKAGTGDLGPLHDERTKAEFAAEVKSLLKQIDDARDAGNSVLEEELQVKVEWIAKEVKAGQGLGGRDRPTKSPVERQRINVGKAIRRALAEITGEHPPLGVHLRAITTGVILRYDPPPGERVDWDL